MTLLRPLFERKAAGFGTGTLPTTLSPRDDVITSSTLMDVLGALNMGGDYTATYEEIVRKQLWVRVAVNKLSYATAVLPLKTFKRDGEDVERADESPLAALIRRPNATKQTGTTSQFIGRVVQDLYTFSNALIVKVQARPDAAPTELRPVSPRGWAIDDNGDYVRRRIDGSPAERFKPWQVIHIIEPGPQDNGFGVSRLEAARLTLAIEFAAQKLGAATFQNGARPGGIINVDNKSLPNEPKARAAAVERFKAEIMRRFGGVDNAGLPAVLEGDVSWLAMSHNLDDAAVVAHRQLTRTEVAALFDIPQPAMGILDNANFASIDALHLMFYQDTLGWPINLLEETLNAQLVTGVPDYAGHYLEFDMNALLRGNPDTRSQTYQRLITVGVMTQNEARRLENLKPSTQPEADQLHTPVFLAPNPALQEADNQGGVT